MEPKKKILTQLEDFKALLHKHQVKALYLFGSSLNNRFNENSSDIDLLVEIDEKDPMAKGEMLIALWDALEAFFQRKVDLLTDSSIKNPVLKKNIEASKIKIYDGGAEKILIEPFTTA